MAACDVTKTETADCISISIETPGCGVATLNQLWAQALQDVTDFIGKGCDKYVVQAAGAWSVSGCKCEKKKEEEQPGKETQAEKKKGGKKKKARK